MNKQLQPLIQNLLDHLEIIPESLDIFTDDNNTLHLNLKLSEVDTDILIGYHGETVAALQLILGILLYKQTNTWTRLIVNIGDYRQKRQETLEKMAQTTAQKVKFSGEPIALFDLNPFERRLIHTYLADHSDVVTESEGEGKNRHLIIKSKHPAASPPLPEPPPLEEH